MGRPLRLILPLLALVLLSFSGCLSGQPDMDDPQAMAEYLCEKTQAMAEMVADGDFDEATLTEHVQEIDALEAEIRAYHADTFPDFNSKMEAHFMEVCQLPEPQPAE